MSDHQPYEGLIEDDELVVADTKAEAARRREVEDFRWVLASEQGRRFVDRLIGMAGVYAPTYLDGTKEGRRMFGVELLAEIESIAPEKCLLMLTERLKRIEDAKHD